MMRAQPAHDHMDDRTTTLAINAGSSSIKCGLFTFEAEPQQLARETFNGTVREGTTRLVDWIGKCPASSVLAAIGHRIVHGGPAYRDPQRLSPSVLENLRGLIPFAPNHLPDEIALVEMLNQHFPAVPQIACFDTAFHADMPPVARRLPIPAVYDQRGVRRYGFHGLSYAFLLQQLEHVAGPEAADGRVILAHLGNGSSLAAVRERRSVDTTMAFTPMGGVVMSTRSGDLDPGVITYLARSEQLSATQLEHLLSHDAGLVALSGSTGDVRLLLEKEASDDACRLAVAAYVYGVKKAIGSLAAVLGGIDTLIFSGGIGEHAAVIRARICHGLEHLGIQLSPAANEIHAAVVSSAASRVNVRVIPTDEEVMIAQAAYRVFSRDRV
jgi:acetate kinase